MKKIFSFIFAATAVFAATSCQEEIAAPENESSVLDNTMTITATVGQETKTVLADNGVSTHWTSEDKISLFDYDTPSNNRCFEIVEEGADLPASTATFLYEGDFVLPEDEQSDPAVVALYPYQENAVYNEGQITGLNIPSEQTALANDFDATATFALATGRMSTKDNLNFSNLYSLLKVSFVEEGIKKVTVTVGENEFIAGEATINLTEVDTEFEGGTLVASGSNTVTLNCEEGFETDKTYYIAVAPVTYTSISVAIDGKVVKESTSGKTLFANTIYNILGIDYNRADRALAFTNDEVTVTVTDDDFDFPALTGEAEGAVYSSSDEEVATVDKATGAVTIVGAGETTITATAPKTDEYLEGSASYTLTVTPDHVRLYVESEKTDFTMNIYFWDIDDIVSSSSWPGNPLFWDESEHKYYYDFPLDLLNKDLDFLINVNGDEYKSADYNITFDAFEKNQPLNWKWLYLKPNSNWKQANARFAAYFFDNGDTWISMTKLNDDFYGVRIPTDKSYPKVIFCRMNPDVGENNFNDGTKWNQTGDLIIPTNGNNLYTINDGSWSDGTWSTK